MPPREIPLPDHPDEIWPHDRQYPELSAKNFVRSWWSEHARRAGEEDDSDFEERYRKAVDEEKRRDEAKLKSTIARSTTVTARDAVSALSNSSRPARPRPASSFAAPTIAVKARQPAVIKKPSPIDRHPRFTAAKAASNNTIGYSKGRAVSSSSMRSLGDIHVRPASAAAAAPVRDVVPDEVKERALKTSLKLSELFIADDDDGNALNFPSVVKNTDDDDLDELEDFQLDPIEEI
jgi:hypothetical protein